MKRSMSSIALAAVLLLAQACVGSVAWAADVVSHTADSQGLVYSERSLEARAAVTPRLQRAFAKRGLQWGAPIFVRIFKQPSVLQLWVQGADGRFVKFKTYAVCERSGELGPKVEAGDDQAPEGFYSVNAAWMHPWSDYYLAFNIRYPNAYDHMHGYSGKAIMVHGGCSSSGCFAMTDENIAEIYTLAEAAIKHGQRYFQVHVFPFALTDAKLKAHAHSRWADFWKNLQLGYQLFETTHKPPQVFVAAGRYQFVETTRECSSGQAPAALSASMAALLQQPLPVARSGATGREH